MTCRPHPTLLVALLFVTSCLAQERITESESSPKRPNILFIFADDHGWQAVSSYGSGINQTPNIDRLAREGMLFRNCCVTNSICGPSRAVILTGKYSHLNGFKQNRDTFDGSQQTFPKILQTVGYETAVIGKWHLKSLPTGFDHYDILRGQGPYYNPPMIHDGQTRKHTGYTTDIITDKALDWLKEQRDPSKPFMLMCQHKAPHRNWQPGPKYLNKYDGEQIKEPPTLFDDYKGRGTPARTQEMTVANHLSPNDLKFTQPRNFTPEQLKTWNKAYAEKNKAFKEANLSGDDLTRWQYQRYAKDYLRCIDSVDENVGRLLDYLDETGLAENTVVIYSSDQGWYLGEHGWYDKRWMYEESLRTPLLIRWPNVAKPNTENQEIVSNLDFAETFLDIAGANVPEDMQGASLVPMLRGESPSDWRSSFYYHYYEFPGAHAVRRHYGVRTDRYKLIHFYRINEWEFYDLKTDPLEMTSQYDNPDHAQTVAEMKRELERLRADFKVPRD